MPTMTRTVALSVALHAAALALCLAAGGRAVYAPSTGSERVIAIRLGGGEDRSGAEAPSPPAPPPTRAERPKVVSPALAPPPQTASPAADRTEARIIPASADGASGQPAPDMPVGSVAAPGAAFGEGAAPQGEEAASEAGEPGPAPTYAPAVLSVEPTAEYLAGIRAAIERVLTYPPLALRRGWEGTVVTSFFIDTRGMPSDIQVTRGSGYGILDRETVGIIERASPYPPLGGRVELPVSFRIRTP